jgi:type IV secretory pathway TraG/TraD family ATPase VirD4
MRPPPQRQQAGRDPAEYIAAALAALLGPPAALAWAAAQLAALTAHGRTVPLSAATLAHVVLALPQHLSDPAAAYPAAVRPLLPGPTGMYAAAAVVLAAAGGIGLAGWRLWRRHARRRPGYASGTEVRKHLSAAALRRRAVHTHPTSHRRRPTDELGLSLGRDASTGIGLWGSAEDSYFFLGPPRIGKGIHLVIPQLLASPGPALSTATRPDTFRATHRRRSKTGPVRVFDPKNMAGGKAPRLRWSPLRGCADPLIALNRARAFTAGARLDDLRDGAHWDAMTQAIIRGYLQAAALAELPPSEILGWTVRPVDPTPIRILRHHPKASPGWAEELAQQKTADPRLRDSVWSGVRRAFDSFADPRVLANCSPEPEEAFEPAEFLAKTGTLYLLGPSETHLSVAPLICALLEDLLDAARRRAADQAGGRLDPPLLLSLDEAANIAPIPTLPQLLADGGGSGITTVAVLQSLQQARMRWGVHGAGSMWDAATIKTVLGGLGESEDLTKISSLAGDIDAPVQTQTRGHDGITVSTTLRRIPALPVQTLRCLDTGRAIVLPRNAPPVETVLTPYRRRSRWRRQEVDTETQVGAEPQPAGTPAQPQP